MKKMFLGLISSSLIIFSSCVVAKDCNHNNYGEAVLNFDKNSKNESFLALQLEHRAMKLCYNSFFVYFDPLTKTPLWVSEYVTEDAINSTKVTRKGSFMLDPKVPYGPQASLNDYRGSGFDRGQNAPAANMKNELAMSQSFYLTNMVPQVGPNMKRTIWAELENKVRYWVKEKGDLDIITGPIFQGNIDKIGRSNVHVPSHLFKIIYSNKTNESIAYIMPNVQIMTRRNNKVANGNDMHPQTKKVENCGGVCEIDNFVATVDKVEQLTGFLFFPENTKINKTSININVWN